MTTVNPLGPWMEKDAFGISIKSDHPNYDQIIEAIGTVLCDNGRVELGTQLLDSLIKFSEPVDIPEEELSWDPYELNRQNYSSPPVDSVLVNEVSEFLASHSDPDD